MVSDWSSHYPTILYTYIIFIYIYVERFTHIDTYMNKNVYRCDSWCRCTHMCRCIYIYIYPAIKHIYIFVYVYIYELSMNIHIVYINIDKQLLNNIYTTCRCQSINNCVWCDICHTYLDVTSWDIYISAPSVHGIRHKPVVSTVPSSSRVRQFSPCESRSSWSAGACIDL